jgi:hypothetical protein
MWWLVVQFTWSCSSVAGIESRAKEGGREGGREGGVHVEVYRWMTQKEGGGGEE